MKAIIHLDVPEWQIGQNVTVYFPDTMQKKGVCELLKEMEAVDKNIGEWKNGHCSCCGVDVSSMLDTWTNVQNFLFCPNCGAKMEGR